MASDIASIKPNPYLFNIENIKKQRARLAHEIGEGAKCRNCDRCDGFQLHFWRKICTNCRCGKDDHDVEEVEEDIGKIIIGKLFERPIRTAEEEKLYSYETNLDMVNEVTGKVEKIAFDWVPPGVAKDLAKKYMEQLPLEKRPVVGSEAAKKRKKQIEQQLPLYDVDESEGRKNMTPEELRNFQKYLEVLRKDVAGQASVQEIVSLLPKQSALPLQSPLKKPFTHSNFSNSKQQHNYPLDKTNDLNLNAINFPAATELFQNLNNNISPRGTTSVDKKISDLSKKLAAANIFDEENPKTEKTLQDQLSRNSSGLVYLKDMDQRNSLPSEFVKRSPCAVLPKDKSQAEPHLRIDKPNYPSVLQSNKLNENIEKNAIENPALSYPQSQLQPTPTQCYSNENIYENIPSVPKEGTDILKPHLPFLSPIRGQACQSSAVQAPYSATFDNIVDPGHKAYESEVKIILPSESADLRNQGNIPKHSEEAILSSFFCQYCNEAMVVGDVAVICERAGPGKYWHPSCFVCATCKELLADLIYFFKDGQVYCGRHYHEAISVPRCHACDELIFVESWTRADGFDWHLDHFCCFICDNPLGGSKYVPNSKGFPHCISCYMSFLARMCESCEEKISPYDARTSYRGYSYHATAQCFSCFKCRKPLIGLKFKMAKNWIFCSQDCINSSAVELSQNINPKEKISDNHW